MRATIKSNEGDAQTHAAAFKAAANALDGSARIGTDGCGCRLAMTAPARAAMESAARKTKALATALRTRSTDVRAVHGGLDTTDREDAGRLANA